MAKTSRITKPSGRQRPANLIRIRWEDRAIPDKPDARRRMLREVSRTADDQAIHSILWWARLPTIPADEMVCLKDLTPAQAKRLKTMSTAELKALAKQQAKTRGEAVRS
jgi:hypothetical protein